MKIKDLQDLLVKPGTRPKLRTIDPGDSSLFPAGKEKSAEALKEMNSRLESLQELLFAEHKHRVLIVLQGMDTSGKDGVVRHVFEGVNPQGVRVVGFKSPTAEELDRDFLWRVHRNVPAKGEIVIFNRSHYEDVLAVRVRKLVPEKVWRERFTHIRHFEKLLADEGTTILKFFLHISREEQKERLTERQREPKKQWKFNPGDLDDRKLWPHYQKAYEDAIAETSTESAPWYIIPADKKWCRNLAVSTVILDALERLDMRYPSLPVHARRIAIR